MDFKDILKNKRKDKGLSQVEFGKVFNLSKQAISSYENGISFPNQETLNKFADYFDVSVDYLLGRTDIEKPYDYEVKNTQNKLLQYLSEEELKAFEKLGKILENKRNDLNLSIRKAANLIGISHTYLSNLEKAIDPRSGTPVKPTIDTLKLISDAYKIDINIMLKLAGYDIVIASAKDTYSGEELAKLVPEEYKKAFKKLNIEQIKFVQTMAEEEIDPEMLMKATEIVRMAQNKAKNKE